MSTLNHYCSICEKDHLSKEAVTWCPECEDFLCSNCGRVHTGSKASSQHVVIKMENYRKLPASILSIRNKCLLHNSKYEFYCTTHGKPCCVMCTRNEHHDCHQICPIQQVTENAKSSTAIQHLEEDLTEIESTFDAVKSNIKTNISEIGRQKVEFLTEISEVRKFINDHLDNIEKQVTDDLSSKEQALQDKFKKLLSDMEERRTKFNKIGQDLKLIKQYASNLQTFIGVNEMVSLTDENVKKFKQVLTYDHYTLEIDIPAGLLSFVENVPTFGIISVVQQSREQSLISGVKSQTQTPLTTLPKTTPTIDKKIKIHLPTAKDEVNIRGSEILPDGKVLFADSKGNKLIMCSADGKHEKDIRLQSSPFEVKYTEGNDIVAVTFPEKTEIGFINVATDAYIRTVNTSHSCWGSDTNSQKLVVRALPLFSSSHLISLSLNGDFIDRVYIPGWNSTNISVRDDAIVCSDWRTNTVSGYTPTGETLWTLKDVNILRTPLGIAIDKCRRVFVAGRDSNNVVLLSPSGQFCSEFLSEKDGLKRPYSLRINIDRAELLVCNQRDGQAFLISMRY